MKTKEIYLVMAASMMVVAGWAAWRFGATPEFVEPPANTSLSAQKTTPVTQEATSSISHRTGKPIVSQVIETPEMKMARFSAETKRLLAKSKPLTETYKAGGIKGSLNAQRDLRKPEDMAFLKSLGLSDELRDKVYQMLRAKGDLYWDHKEQMSEALRTGETYTAYGSELRQMNADLEAAVGAENYRKLNHWEATLLERNQTAEFKRYLQGQSLPLTEQQEAAVVDAMVQGRGGKTSFSLRSPSIPIEDKLAYIDTLKQRLAPVLNANDMALLEQHLKEVAGKTLTLQALSDLHKRAEDRKSKASNPLAPPR